MNRLASALIVASIGLGLAGVWSTLTSTRPDGTLTVDPGSCDFGSLSVKQRGIVNVAFRNDSGSPVRILGSADYCTRKGCLSSLGLPIRIGPGGSATVRVAVLPYVAGVFAQDLRFFSDLPGRERLDVTIRGSVPNDGALTLSTPGVGPAR